MNNVDENEKKTNEEQDFYKYAMSVIRENSDNRFVVKRRNDYENLIKKPIYTKATIRVKMPNDQLIQANFALMETVGDIYQFVKEHLNDPNEEFYLFTPFPKKNYSDKSQTIHSQSLAPSTVLNISFPNLDVSKISQYQFLKESSLEKFRTEYKL